VNLGLLQPEICLAITAIAAIFADLLFRRKMAVTLTALLGIVIAAALALPLNGVNPGPAGNGLFTIDSGTVFFRLFFLAMAFLLILVSSDYVKKMHDFHGEFIALLLLATLGATLAASASNIITILLSIELMAVSFYALVGFLKSDKGTESALKYILLGAVNAAVLLFGMALLFGFSASLTLDGIAIAASAGGVKNAGLILGLTMVLAALGFKIAAVPFHMWAPDTYEGAPAPVALYLSTASKIAGFAVMLRVLSAFLQPASFSHNWGVVIAVISAITMTVGNLLAISQSNIKRLLAYSSVAQAGYMLVAIAAIGTSAGDISASSLLYFAIAFAAAEFAVFGVVIVVSRQVEHDEVADYTGMARRSPWLAGAMTLGLLSLIGLPPLGGFIGKFYVFSQATQHGLLWLVIIAVINSVISAYYYLRIIKTLWAEEPATREPLEFSFGPKVALTIASLAILALGLIPDVFTRATEFGARLLLP